MAGEAGVLLGELLVGVGRKRSRKNRGRGEEEGKTLHACSLRVFFKFTRSGIGARQVTPWHSHALTGSGRTGFSRVGGRPFIPSGNARTMTSGRNSRASSACQAGRDSLRPRRIKVRGGRSISSSAMAMAPNPAG